MELFTLGSLYVSDFIKDGENPRGDKHELKMMLNEESGLVQLEKTTPLDVMYGKYWYRSGINNTMRNELKSIANSCLESIEVSDGDVFLDIACNDGTLLSYVPKNLRRIGIDPADDSYKKESMKYADEIVQDYFTLENYKNTKFGDKKAKIITAIAMFYDLDDPSSFLDDVIEVLDDEGLFVMQLSYTPLMIIQLAFDNICHEHICYYSLFSLRYILDKKDLDIVDVQLNDVNGGSFRVYIRKKKSDQTKFKTSPYRDVANYRINSILEYENKMNFNKADVYKNFYKKISKLREQTVSFIKKEKSRGKVIWGYGASTKGNTLLQWYGLDSTLIDAIAERSPYKYGLKTVGTNIPIYSEAIMREKQPDYLIVLPWHYISEFKKRETEYLKLGGKFIMPSPKFEIISI